MMNTTYIINPPIETGKRTFTMDSDNESRICLDTLPKELLIKIVEYLSGPNDHCITLDLDTLNYSIFVGPNDLLHKQSFAKNYYMQAFNNFCTNSDVDYCMSFLFGAHMLMQPFDNGSSLITETYEQWYNVVQQPLPFVHDLMTLSSEDMLMHVFKTIDVKTAAKLWRHRCDNIRYVKYINNEGLQKYHMRRKSEYEWLSMKPQAGAIDVDQAERIIYDRYLKEGGDPNAHPRFGQKTETFTDAMIDTLEGILDMDQQQAVKLAEDVLIFIYDVVNCRTFVQAVRAITVFVKLRTNGSILCNDITKSIVNYFYELFGAYEPQAEGVFEKLRGILDDYLRVRESSIFKKLYKLMMYCLTFSIFSPLGITFDKLRYSKIEQEAIASKCHLGPDLMYTIADSIVFICERGYQCVKTGSMDPMFHSSQSYEKWYSDCKQVQQWSKLLSSAEDHGFSEEAYYDLLTSCIDRGAAIVKFIDKKENSYEFRAAQHMVFSLKELLTLYVGLDNLTKVRDMPFSLLLFSDTAMGKTTIMEIIRVHYGKIAGLPVDDRFKYTKNSAAKYWDAFRTCMWFVIMDELASNKPTGQPDESSQEVLMVNNPNPYIVNMAPVDDKGKVKMNAKVVIGTTNVKNLNASYHYSCPSAVQRRFPYVVTPKVKEEFSINGMLSSQRVKEQGADKTDSYPDFWTWTVEKVVPRKVVNSGPHIASANCTYEVVLDDVSLREFLVWLTSTIKQHIENNKTMASSVSSIKEVKLCEYCHLPISMCECLLPHSGEQDCESDSDTSSMSSDDIISKGTLGGYIRYKTVRWAVRKTLDKLQVQIIKLTLKGLLCVLLYFMFDSLLGLFGAVQIALVSDRIWKLLKEFWHWYVVIPPQQVGNMYKLRAKTFGLASCIDDVNFWKNLGSKGAKFIARPKLLGTIIITMAFVKIVSRLYNQFMKPEKRVIDDDFLWDSQTGECYRKAGKKSCLQIPVKEVTKAFVNKSSTSLNGHATSVVKDNYVLPATIAPIETDYDPHTASAPVPLKDEVANVWYKEEFQLSTLDVGTKTLSYKGLSDDQFINILSRNIIRLNFIYKNDDGVLKKKTTVALCITSNIYLLNAHAVPDKDSFVVEQISQNIVPGVTENYKSVMGKDLFTFLGNDLSVVQFTGLPLRKSIMQLIAKQSTRLVSNGFYVSRDIAGKVEKICVNKIYFQSKLHSLVLDTHIDSWSCTTDRPTQVGDCGSPLIAQSEYGPVLVGIHYLGSGSSAKAICLHYESLEKVLTLFKYKPQAGEPMLSSSSAEAILSELHYKSEVRYMETGLCRVYGSFKGHRASGRSRVGPTLLQNDMVKSGIVVKHGAPHLSGYKPWRNALLPIIQDRPQFNISIMHKAFAGLEHDIISKLTPEMLEMVQPYDWDTVVNGADGVAFVDKINRNTSAGHPWNKSKRHFMTFKTTDGVVTERIEFTTEIMDRVYERDSLYRKGFRTCPISTCTLKDEALKFEKINAFLSRLFEGSPVDFTIVSRKYYMSLVRLIQNYKHIFECCVGVVAQSVEWELILYDMRKIGTNFDNGDFKNFDKKHLAEIMILAIMLLVKIAELSGNYEYEDLLAMVTIGYDIAFMFVNFNGTLLEFLGSLPSGCIITVILNCLINSGMMRYVYIVLNPSKECDTFQENVCLRTYGDDNVFSVSDKTPWYNHVNISRVYADVGIVYTMADKTAEITPYVPESSLSFLKRSWRFDEDIGHYVAPLEESSIHKSLTVWNRSKTISPEAQMIAIVESAVNEYFWYGKKVFIEKREWLRDLVRTNNLMLWVEETTFPSWEELVNRFAMNSHKRHVGVWCNVPLIQNAPPNNSNCSSEDSSEEGGECGLLGEVHQGEPQSPYLGEVESMVDTFNMRTKTLTDCGHPSDVFYRTRKKNIPLSEIGYSSDSS